jgi:hypothetical protein
MLRSTPAQPGSVSKHAQHPMQRILAQPLRFSAPPAYVKERGVPPLDRVTAAG